jgi:transcription initiation factor IIE alpha subunit
MYLVFVCPKCKLNAQLLEPGHKTVTCQRCSSKIQTSRLRFFGSFEDRNEAVKLRSVLQGQLVGGSFSDTAQLSLLEDPVQPKKEAKVQTKMPKAPKSVEIIRAVLLEKGPMILIDCEYYCKERGVTSETFQKILQKMIEAGEVFRPEKGLIALVP